MRPTRTAAVALALALGMAAGGLPERADADDMMSVCAPEIGKFCSGVSQGRGRVMACLIGYGNKLGSACNAQVQAAASRSGSNPLVPSGARRMLSSGAAGDAPAACSADAAKVCPGSERTLACLYAHADQVTKTCSDAIRTALN